MVVAFLWIFLMRLIAGVMVWLSLILTILLLATSTAFSWFKYSALRDNPTTNTTISEAFHHNPLTQVDKE